MKDSDPFRRSFASITLRDLERLLELAHRDRDEFATYRDWAELYPNPILRTTLCQGAALRRFGSGNVLDTAYRESSIHLVENVTSMRNLELAT